MSLLHHSLCEYLRTAAHRAQPALRKTDVRGVFEISGCCSSGVRHAHVCADADNTER